MAKKPTVSTVSTGYQANTTINSNFDNVRNAFDNTLSLDGSTPNAMTADFDLNSNDLLNAGTVNATNIVVGGVSLTDQVTLAQDAADDAIAAASVAAGASTSAATSATNAATSASAASTSASSASSSASAASSSASAAATSASSAATLYDNFDDRYLGNKASDPTLDNDGNALLTGALYFNTTTGLKAYNGSVWLSLDGDMKKATYDADNDGIVDAAETVPWAGVSSTPTTISGYGITNAYTKTEVDTALALKLDDSQATTFGLSLLDDTDASAARTTLGLGTLATQSGTFSGTSSGTNTGDQSLFSTVAVSGQSNVVADSASDTLTLVAGTNVTITTDASTDSITINATGGGGGGASTLDDLTDVTITAAATGDILRYNGAAWVDYPDSNYASSSHSHPFADITSKPTTISGYGITDAYTKTEVDTALALKLDDSQATAFGLSLLDDADASAARTTLGLGTLATQSGTFSGTSSGTNTGDQNLFSTITVSGQSNVVADTTSDTLTLAAGSNITLTTNATTDTITIASTGGGGLTLVGTISTTSGASASISGLDLTGYKVLILAFDAVSHNSASSWSFLLGTSTSDDIAITATFAAADTVRGMVFTDLTTGSTNSFVGAFPASSSGGIASRYGGTAIRSSSTSISVAFAGGSFDGGAIYVYGG